VPGRGIPIDQLKAKPASEVAALRGLPPLIKGYLRLGAYVCEDAVIDYQFGTTDIFLVLPSERISTRYINFYGADATRHAA
jgi:putative hemolysin